MQTRLQVIPYKVSLDELEILLADTPEAEPVQPGQLLRLESDGNFMQTVVYGRVLGMKRAPQKDAHGHPMLNLRVQVLLGEPNVRLSVASVLSGPLVAQEVEQIQGEVDYPIALGQNFQADFMNLGTLTLIAGASLEDKQQLTTALIHVLAQYQRVMVLDPLGVFEAGNGLPIEETTVVRAGHDAGLSLQAVGLKRFLAYLSDMLPDIIRTDTLQILAEAVPLGQTFYPFKDLLRLENVLGHESAKAAVKTPLMNCLYEIDRQQVFADSPRDVFTMQAAMRNPITLVDLSGLSEPWKTLFYEEVCLELLANAGGDILPVLVYPENYLKQFENYVKKANEADMTMLVLASPYCPPALSSMVDNRFYWNALGDILLEGRLTFGLPVTLTLPEGTDFDRDDEDSAEMAWADEVVLESGYTADDEEPVQDYGQGYSKYQINPDAQMIPGWQPLPEEAPVYQSLTPDSSLYSVEDESESGSFDSILGSVEDIAEMPDVSPEVSLKPLDNPEEALSVLEEDEFNFELGLSEAALVEPAPDRASIYSAEANLEGDSVQSVPWSYEPQIALDPDEGTIGSAYGLAAETETVMIAEPPPVVQRMRDTQPGGEHPENASLFQVGDRVQSDKYGVGQVQKLIPMEMTTAVHVLFDNGTKRTIVPSATNLQKI